MAAQDDMSSSLPSVHSLDIKTNEGEVHYFSTLDPATTVEVKGSILVFESGHTIKVQDTQADVMALLADAGVYEHEFVYFSPYWQIDDFDQIAVRVKSVVAVREIRELVSGQAQ